MSVDRLRSVLAVNSGTAASGRSLTLKPDLTAPRASGSFATETLSREAPKQRGGPAKPADECYAFAWG